MAGYYSTLALCGMLLTRHGDDHDESGPSGQSDRLRIALTRGALSAACRGPGQWGARILLWGSRRAAQPPPQPAVGEPTRLPGCTGGAGHGRAENRAGVRFFFGRPGPLQERAIKPYPADPGRNASGPLGCLCFRLNKQPSMKKKPRYFQPQISSPTRTSQSRGRLRVPFSLVQSSSGVVLCCFVLCRHL